MIIAIINLTGKIPDDVMIDTRTVRSISVFHDNEDYVPCGGVVTTYDPSLFNRRVKMVEYHRTRSMEDLFIERYGVVEGSEIYPYHIKTIKPKTGQVNILIAKDQLRYIQESLFGDQISIESIPVNYVDRILECVDIPSNELGKYTKMYNHAMGPNEWFVKSEPSNSGFHSHIHEITDGMPVGQVKGYLENIFQAYITPDVIAPGMLDTLTINSRVDPITPKMLRNEGTTLKGFDTSVGKVDLPRDAYIYDYELRMANRIGLDKIVDFCIYDILTDIDITVGGVRNPTFVFSRYAPNMSKQDLSVRIDTLRILLEQLLHGCSEYSAIRLIRNYHDELHIVYYGYNQNELYNVQYLDLSLIGLVPPDVVIWGDSNPSDPYQFSIS